MSLNNEDKPTESEAESESIENEIFKTLNHQIRRNIIKLLGKEKELTFTEIKNNFSNIDSPSLAYHLKTLKQLIELKDSSYFLTEIGQTALILMDKIDQSDRLKNWKKNIMWSNIATIICWTFVMFTVPFMLGNNFSQSTLITVIIILNVVAQINFQLIWRFWAKSWIPKPKKKKKNQSVQ
jgi:DNA-binding transcriptional ArsR family regulator